MIRHKQGGLVFLGTHDGLGEGEEEEEEGDPAGEFDPEEDDPDPGKQELSSLGPTVSYRELIE